MIMEEKKVLNDTQSLKDIFEEFEKTSRIPSSGLISKNFLSYSRVGKLIDIIDRVKKSLVNQFKEFGDLEINITPSFEINEPITNAANFVLSEDPSSGTKTLKVSQNFNFNKLALMPGPEAYTCVYYPLYNATLKRISAKTQQGENQVDFGKKGDEQSKRKGLSIEEYIKAFLLKVFLGEYEKIDNSAVHSIAQQFSQNGITSETLFDNPNGLNIFEERYAKVVKQDSLQQSTFLLGEFSKSTENDLNALQSADENQLREFCERYARTILAGAGIKQSAVKFTFEPKGDVGQYIDYGTYQELNINLNKIARIKNPAEIVMTLSHELTHAIDSTVNKARGKTEEGGYGLLDNLVGDSKQDLKKLTNEPQEVVDYFKELNRICYHVNPNERSARLGELTAIMFMQGMHPDSRMQEYIQKSISSYKREQSKVVKSINSVQDIQSKYLGIKRLASKETRALIEERLDYLNSLSDRGMLNADQELEAIAIAMNSKREALQIDLQEEQLNQMI